jgi:cobalt-zinc-cadmium efflux system membrane fusion protein
MNTDKRSILIILASGALLAAAILFWQRSPSHASDEHGDEHAKPAQEHEGHIALSEEQIKTANINTARAGSASIAQAVQLPGEVRFNEDRTAHIVPRLPGVAESVSADLGQQVKKGQVLAVISSPELAELRSAELAARKRLDLARLTYEREQKLWQDKISAEQDFLQARQALREAEINEQAASAKLSALGAPEERQALSRYVLRAPFDGMVVEKHIALGEAVKEDANVFLLSDLSSVWVEVVVTPQDLESVRVGDQAIVRSSATSSAASGVVSHVGALLGEQTRTAKARVVLDNPQRAWRPGLLVNVALQRGERTVPVAVKAEAVNNTEGKQVVYVRNKEGFEATPVRTGASDGSMVEILDGLKSGAEYAASGSFVLKAQQGKDGASHDH